MCQNLSTWVCGMSENGYTHKIATCFREDDEKPGTSKPNRQVDPTSRYVLPKLPNMLIVHP